jgi:hypothetical protein
MCRRIACHVSPFSSRRSGPPNAARISQYFPAKVYPRRAKAPLFQRLTKKSAADQKIPKRNSHPADQA